LLFSVPELFDDVVDSLVGGTNPRRMRVLTYTAAWTLRYPLDVP